MTSDPVTWTRIEVGTHEPSEVLVGPGALRALAEDSGPSGPAVVVTDETVEGLHLARLGSCRDLPRLAVKPGEDSKSFATLERVLDFMLAAGLDRRATLIAFGGGVVGDLGGLAAALFMRGIDCVQCPTTLLAQVDSSVGGKTAVNLKAGKNLAGAFHQPRRVLADTEVLATLPDEELRSGLGEVVKSAVIGDEQLLALLETQAAGILARDEALLAEIVARCVRVKAGIVARDEKEAGERKFLNLGHTFAHGIEHAAGYGRIPHGIAVAVGLGLALRASARAGLLAEPELEARVARVSAALGIPANLPELRRRSRLRLDGHSILAGMRHDKKGSASQPAFVLVRGLGRLESDQELESATLAALLD